MRTSTLDTGEFPIAKALREKIFKIPLLPQEQILEKFRELDEILQPLCFDLVRKIPLLQSYFEEIVFRIASGNTLGKNFFDKEDHEDERTKKRKALLNNSEQRVLRASFSILRDRASIDQYIQRLQEARFIRGVLEDAVEGFLGITKDLPEEYRLLKKAQETHSLEYIRHERNIQKVFLDLEFPAHEFPDLEEAIRWLELASVQWSRYLALRDELISPYFRLVYTLALKCSKSDSQTLDNFQNGILGLIRAVKCYTPGRFAAFSLVAKSWIRQSILLHFKSEVNFIKLPVANWNTFQKLEKVRQTIETQTNREATLEEISKLSKIDLQKVQRTYDNAKLIKVFSLNAPTQNEDNQATSARWNLDSIVAEDEHEKLELRNEYARIEEVLRDLDEEEKTIFTLISGCFDFVKDQSQLNEETLLRESIRQKAARMGMRLQFK